MNKIKTILILVSLMIAAQKSNSQCSSFPIVVNGPISASQLLSQYAALMTNANNINGKSFNLNGTLTIDINLTISNAGSVKSIMEMGGGAKIIVNPNCSLVISGGTWLRSCSSTGPMWEGIEVAPPTVNTDKKTVIVTGGSIIEDAIHAIYAIRTSGAGGYLNLNIDGAIFNRNYRSIHLENQMGAGNIINSVKIINSQFYCRTIWNNPGTSGKVLHAPYNSPAQRSFAQMDLRKAIFNPNTVIGVNNTIDNADYGVKIYYDMLTIDNLTSSNTNFNIITEFDGYLQVKNCQLSNAAISGVEAHHYLLNVIIHDNTFTNNAKAIYVHDNLTEISIYNNTINNSSTYGIQGSNCVWLSTTPFKIDIYNNSVSATAATADGIYWSETNSAVSVGSFFKIHDNPTITGVRKAIELLNVPAKPEVTNNTNISINPNAGFGIKITNSPNALIKSNIVTGTDNVTVSACTTNTAGIINEASMGANIRCNTVQKTTKGFVFKGVTSANQFLQNTMGKAQDQFYLENNVAGLGNVGSASSPSLNVWQAGACDGYKNTNGLLSNTTSQGGFTKFYYYTAGGGQNPAFNAMTGTPGVHLACTKQPTSFLPQNGFCTTVGGGTSAALLEPIVDGSTTWAEEDKASELMAKEYVYEEVKNDPALLQSQVLSDAVTEIENSVLGELLEVTDTIPNDTTVVDSLLLVNQNISVNYLPEENLKLINELLLIEEDAGFTTYDAAQIQIITDIANQCPLQGGNAVYIARAILANLTGNAGDYESDCDNYTASAGNRTTLQTSSPTRNIAVEKTVTRIDYYDLQGRYILSIDISVDKELKLLNGIYLAKYFSNDELISNQKVVIQK